MTRRLPVVLLELLEPFLENLESNGVDPEHVLGSMGLNMSAARRPGALAHSNVIHAFLEKAAEAAKDPYLGAKVGSAYNTRGWSLLVLAMRDATLVSDYLIRYIDGANRIATSATQYLRVEGNVSFLGERRLVEPTVVPTQNDAFMAMLHTSILKDAVGKDFDQEHVTIAVCDPTAIPKSFEVGKPLGGNRLGYSIRFPTSWLLRSVPKVRLKGALAARLDDLPVLKQDFLSDLKAVIHPHVGNGPISVDMICSMLGYSKATLRRALKEHQTSISELIVSLQMEHAKDALSNTATPLSEIAFEAGYATPANFTTAFKRRYGVSPSSYRKSN